MSRVEQRFEPGRYRLVVMPADVDTRVVARLQPVTTPVTPAGHGPHALTFDQVQKFQWREPEAKDAPRLPDRWTFTLHGTAHIVLDVSDGMIADLVREAGDVPPDMLVKLHAARKKACQPAAGPQAWQCEVQMEMTVPNGGFRSSTVLLRIARNGDGWAASRLR
jgi:hypothetical protein